MDNEFKEMIDINLFFCENFATLSIITQLKYVAALKEMTDSLKEEYVKLTAFSTDKTTNYIMKL